MTITRLHHRAGEVQSASRVLSVLSCLCMLGCGFDETLTNMNMAQFRKQCAAFGFQQGTTAFSNCMMQQSAERDHLNQHIVDRMNRK